MKPIINLNDYRKKPSFPTVEDIDRALEEGNREIDEPGHFPESSQKLAEIIQITRSETSEKVQ
jgi:hypothetical protein